ncbi:MAG TPA: GNAT family N-acetyltransferase [Mycobacteriales bacterium]|nr:GNAT family N-acetyltransferase [Mycobacteriales bacterium]
MSELELRVEPYDGATAQRLVAAVQAEYVVRYGGPDESPVDPSEFAPPAGVFLVGYVDGVPVATGAFRRHGQADVEIKRMYVVPEMRGRGLSRLMLAALEERARAAGASQVVLETGDKQPEAISLYESSGYERSGSFGHYACRPGSYSFAKKL